MLTINLSTKLNMQIQVTKLDRNKMLKFQVEDKQVRNCWCTDGVGCPKYSCRPCCPPKVPMFNELKSRKYIYLIKTKITKIDYFNYSPKSEKSKSANFLFLSAAHKITRSMNNKIVQAFQGQIFIVGSCSGCKYQETKVCKRLAPRLEGTGINVCELSKEIFNEEIQWNKPSKMIAIGAIYTDEIIQKSKFMEVVYNLYERR